MSGKTEKLFCAVSTTKPTRFLTLDGEETTLTQDIGFFADKEQCAGMVSAANLKGRSYRVCTAAVTDNEITIDTGGEV